MKPNIFTLRVYYEDTDEQGIVYHANYLKFFERARVEAFRGVDIELRKLLSEHDSQFVVHSLEIKYLQPAYLDQLLYISTEIVSHGFASLYYCQKAFLGAADGGRLCQANIRLACVDREYRPKRLPEVLIGELKK